MFVSGSCIHRWKCTLDHPNIATIYALEQADNLLFIALQFVPGTTLAARLADDRLVSSDAVSIALQSARALESAHKKGVIHRDLKPANIQVTPEGMVKILDFGLAQIPSRIYERAFTRSLSLLPGAPLV